MSSPALEMQVELLDRVAMVQDKIQTLGSSIDAVLDLKSGIDDGTPVCRV